MNFGFSGRSEKAYVPNEEVVEVEAIVERSFDDIALQIVERRRKACPARDECGLTADTSKGVTGFGREGRGHETVVSCGRLLCNSPEAFSQAAAEIREIGTYDADVEDDTLEEYTRVKRELKDRYSD